MIEVWRLFVALELPADVQTALGRLRRTLESKSPARAVRWVQPSGIHLTLKFLGDVPSGEVSTLAETLRRAAAGHSAFELEAGGLGCFPNRHRPSVLWVGLGGALAELNALQSSVEIALADSGFEAEERGFSPHLTLARTSRTAPLREIEALAALLDLPAAQKPLVRWRVGAFSLMRSELRREGAIYTALHHIPLS
ncbi:MAG: RNA 2',3'-cyclic phosphodiesterase [Anaerolineae bacterium]|nr:RNA 2',3'-cyclic phosphodiesterase [Anaerolineae bacterium]